MTAVEILQITEMYNKKKYPSLCQNPNIGTVGMVKYFHFVSICKVYINTHILHLWKSRSNCTARWASRHKDTDNSYNLHNLIIFMHHPSYSLMNLDYEHVKQAAVSSLRNRWGSKRRLMMGLCCLWHHKVIQGRVRLITHLRPPASPSVEFDHF